MVSSQLKSLAVSLLVAGVLSPGLVSAGQDKVDVCHSEGNGTYHLITIAEPAYPTHVAHGDAGIGEDVPGMSGYVFDEECVPVEAVSCPCTFSADRIRSFFPEGATLELLPDTIFSQTGCDFSTVPTALFFVLAITDGETNAVIDVTVGDGSEHFCGELTQEGPTQEEGPFDLSTYNACAADILQAATDLGFTCTEFTP